jgi:hypothetical protein
MTRLFAGGVGAWTPGFADVLAPGAFAAGAPPGPATAAPRAELLPPALRRRATPLAQMVAAVAAQAAAQAGADLARTPLVLGSALGEIGLAVAMMGEFRQGEGLPSPTRFHNAVHNGPGAYVSIATGNRGFSTAVAAGPETAAAALLEAAALLAERGGEVIVALADEPPPPPFAPRRPFPPLAVALHLSATPGPATRAVLSGPSRAAGRAPALPAPFADHPCAGGLALARAVQAGAAGEVHLGPPGERGWVVVLRPGGAA